MLTGVISFFTPADLRGIGSFQDGGLKYNFTGVIASQLCHQIWPSRKGPARLLSLGTGMTESTRDGTPHFRHIFSDGFLRRGFDAWMSSLDTEQEWRKMKNQTPQIRRSDYFRFNVSLGSKSGPIDAIDMMEYYRNLVILQPGTAHLARDAACSLLISRFYFELLELPPTDSSPFWCHGMIRCKGSAKDVIDALCRLYPHGLDLAADSGRIGHFGGLEDICSECKCFAKPLVFLVRHAKNKIHLSVKKTAQHGWAINGFPESIESFATRQSLPSPFGRGDHGYPGRAPCISCLTLENGGRARGVRRKRGSGSSGDVATKRIRSDIGSSSNTG